MTRERLNELWPVMEHYKNGGLIEQCAKGFTDNNWCHVGDPQWWATHDYRIAQPKPMTFMEAVEAMKQGKKVRKKSWMEVDESICMNKIGTLIVFTSNGKNWPCMASAVEATDWEVVE
jgi:hypothetical protein